MTKSKFRQHITITVTITNNRVGALSNRMVPLGGNKVKVFNKYVRHQILMTMCEFN